MTGQTPQEGQGSENPSPRGCLVIAVGLGLVAGLGWSVICGLVWVILQSR